MEVSFWQGECLLVKTNIVMPKTPSSPQMTMAARTPAEMGSDLGTRGAATVGEAVVGAAVVVGAPVVGALVGPQLSGQQW
mgnify:CR=1 FL=1